MGLSSGERRALAAKGNRLKAHVIIRADELSDTTVAHVRQTFGDKELIKVRISTDDRQQCLLAAQELADRIPCELVQRVGRVALLYRSAAEAGDRQDDIDDNLNDASNRRRDQP